MKKLLIFVDWFAPGFKGGGQIQSCVNLASALQEDMEVLVVTTDRDLGDNGPYATVTPDEWNIFESKVKVMYLSPARLGYKSIQSVIRSVNPDVIYLNSMFSYNLTLLPLEVCRFDNWKIRIVLAPRGMLHAGALQYKKIKKKLFFQAFKIRKFHKRILFHATDGTESQDIRNVFGKHARMTFLNDFPASKQEKLSLIEKIPGSLSCLFISRITPKKNLLLLLKLLTKVQASIQLTIVGPPEDLMYWEECQQIIAKLPSEIRVTFLGPVPNNQLPAIYRTHHLFTLPTFGENFGHVIFESLVNGRPVLISDLTPWKDLEERKVGWDIPLNDEADFTRALQSACDWDQKTFDSYCEASWKFASIFADTSTLKAQYLQLFQQDNE